MEEQKRQKSLGYKVREKVTPPPNYNVVIHNDDYTTMDFVVLLLETVFRKSKSEALALMLKVHHEGKGIAGTYSYDIAQTKAQQGINLARNSGFPLELTVEPEE
jgi:ATP-dependent Clp protease adaptor protein ClpS